jgi:hypothetical protein
MPELGSAVITKACQVCQVGQDDPRWQWARSSRCGGMVSGLVGDSLPPGQRAGCYSSWPTIQRATAATEVVKATGRALYTVCHRCGVPT